MFDDKSGWVAVPGLVTSDEIDYLLKRCNELLALPPEQQLPRDKSAAGTQHLAQLDSRIDLVAQIVVREQILLHVQHLLGPGAKLTQASFRNPGPGFGSQHLHTDANPKVVSGPALSATAIIALTDITTTNGATRVVPGSHERPDLQRQAGSMPNHPDEILLTGRAGTAFVFSSHLLHSGTKNKSQKPRPALQVLWQRQPQSP